MSNGIDNQIKTILKQQSSKIRIKNRSKNINKNPLTTLKI